MTSRRVVVILLLAMLALALMPSLALAGPGGSIAKALVSSFWGKVALAALTVFFLPVILWVMLREWRAERRAVKVLERLSAVDATLHPMRVRERIRECFLRVHSAWSKDQIAEASQVMTDWYWQNQELAHLRRWETEGLVNHCSVKSVGSIRPMHVEAQVVNGRVESATIVALISANMQDYLAERETGKVIEGDKEFKDVDTVWTLSLVGDALKVAQIEESYRSLTYAGQPNVVVGLEESAASRRA